MLDADEPTTFGTLLRQHRVAARLTQELLAERASLGTRSIQGLERDENQPQRETVGRLAQALGLVGDQRARFEAAAQPTPRLRERRSPTNLPVLLTSFVGREREIAEVKALLPGTRLLSIVGPPGTGKTRLALEVVAQLDGAFADGVCFVSLGSVTDARLVVDTIARSLDVRDFGSRPLIENLKEYLEKRELLLFLDNFEQVVAATLAVSDLLTTCPRLTVLVTSRTALGVYGEQEYPLDPLPLPQTRSSPSFEELIQNEAVRLFAERARAVKPGFVVTRDTAPVIGMICHRVDGLPLAIELAATWVKLLPLAALLARLTGAYGPTSLHLLIGGPRSLPARQQTLRNAIAWSYELLTIEERTLFRRLSVFTGGCTLEAAESLLTDSAVPGSGTSPSPRDAGTTAVLRAMGVLAGVGALVGKSLLRQVEGAGGEPRLTMLETLRDFGQECLDASGEMEEIRSQHAAYYLALAEMAEPQLSGPNQRVWLERLETEHENLRATLQLLLDRGDAEKSLRLGAALWRFWFTRGYLSEGRRWLNRALGIESRSPGPARAKALTGAGMLAHYQGDYGQAATRCGESVSLGRSTGDKRGIAEALNGLALVARLGGNLSAARAIYEESLALFREVGDQSGLAYTLAYSGFLVWSQADQPTALSRFQESLAIYRELGDPSGIALATNMLGVAAYGARDLVTAATYWEEALARFRDVGDRRGIARAVRNLADIACLQGNFESAGRGYKESLKICRELGDRYWLSRCLDGFAAVAAAQGQPTVAARLFGAAAIVRQQIGVPQSPSDQRTYETKLRLARASLDDTAFAAAWAEGQNMLLEEAVDLAEKTVQTRPAQEPTRAAPLPVPEPEPSSAERKLHPAGLTARELDVLRLIAIGLTDAEVAERLVLSPRTVNSHLHSIYGKLGVSSRSAATRYAVDHGLA